MDYDPIQSPLELPVQVFRAECRAERPVFFPPRSGTLPGTTLSGTFGRAVWIAGCRQRPAGLPACNELGNPNSPFCRAPGQCPVRWLFKPYSEVHKRHMPRPVILHSPDLEAREPVRDFELQVVLWGRHALTSRPVVEDTLGVMGVLGLKREGDSVPFEVMGVEAGPIATLAERAAALGAVDWQQAFLRFETPFLHQERVESDTGQERLFRAGGDLPLEGILGNVAYELAAWDMEDRALGEALDRGARHGLARDCRDQARALAGALRVVRCNLLPADAGTRQSTGNRGSFPLRGFVGEAELRGPVNDALPWLLALSLRGGGQKTAMGLGVVRFRLGTSELS